MKHIFPFTEVERGSRIVLYGASDRGYDFYRQVLSTGYCEIVLWVDRQYEWYRYMGLPVEPPYRIIKTPFDILIVTPEARDIYDSILKDVIALGIDESKVLWKEDCLIKGNLPDVSNRWSKKAESEDAYRVSPLSFLNKNSLDLIIKYLYACDILSGNPSTKHEHMYVKLVMADNGAVEPTYGLISGFFSEYHSKSGIETFKSSFFDIISSMKKRGFLKEHFVPLDSKGRPVNGRHRISAALAMGTDVWVRSYPFEGIRLDFGSEWLMRNGFDRNQISEILDTYGRLKNK